VDETLAVTGKDRVEAFIVCRAGGRKLEEEEEEEGEKKKKNWRKKKRWKNLYPC
jgi:hypothetical protein